MNKLVQSSNFSFFEDPSFSKLYEFIKKHQWMSIYINGKRYFYFAWRGKVFQLTELQFSLFLSVVVYFLIITIRKGCKRIKLGERTVRLIQKIRGGEISNSNSIMELVDENDVLRYENQLPTGLDYNPVSLIRFDLTSRERFVKSIIKKCLKPGHIYKVTHRGVLEILEKMLDFKKSDDVRMISYDVLVLGLVIVSKPASQIIYQGTTEAIKKVVGPYAVHNLPIISAFLTAITMGFQLNLTLNAGLAQASIRVGYLLLKVWIGHEAAELLRSRLLIDCTDYFKALPQADLKEFPRIETSPELDSSSSENSISYTREEPSRHETFVSTTPNQELHYQEEVKIETLDGQIRRVNKVKGKTIEYVRDRGPVKSIKSSYIPLAQRTRTLADVKTLDSTIDRESAQKITKVILQEQIKAGLILESLNGE